jgi:hypothetical protein
MPPEEEYRAPKNSVTFSSHFPRDSSFAPKVKVWSGKKVTVASSVRHSPMTSCSEIFGSMSRPAHASCQYRDARNLGGETKREQHDNSSDCADTPIPLFSEDQPAADDL